MQTLTERKRYKELKEKCKSAWIDFATAILEIRERKLYLVEYSTFEAFCMEELHIAHNTARYLMAGAKIIQNISTATIGGNRTQECVAFTGSGFAVGDHIPVYQFEYFLRGGHDQGRQHGSAGQCPGQPFDGP